MAEVLAAAQEMFQWMFVTTTGANAHTAAVVTLINLIQGNSFLLIGLSLMVTGVVCKYLAKIIRVS